GRRLPRPAYAWPFARRYAGRGGGIPGERIHIVRAPLPRPANAWPFARRYAGRLLTSRTVSNCALSSFVEVIGPLAARNCTEVGAPPPACRRHSWGRR